MHFGLQGKLCQLTCVNYKLKFNKEEPLNFTARLIMRKKENRTKKMILIIAVVVFLYFINTWWNHDIWKIPDE